MKKYSRVFVFLTISVIAVSMGCVNYKAVKDFGLATSSFSEEYTDVYLGSFKTCIATRQLNRLVTNVASNKGTAYEAGEDLNKCATYKKTGEIYSKTGSALGSFGSALRILAEKSDADYTEQMNTISTNVKDAAKLDKEDSERVDQVNSLAAKVTTWFVRGYARDQLADIIRTSKGEVKGTIDLLQSLGKAYEVQVNLYHDAIGRVSNNEDFKTSSLAISQSQIVEDHMGRYLKRKELLDAYMKSIQVISTSHAKLVAQAERAKPDFEDPNFQKDMKQFLKDIREINRIARNWN
jgi:hypothetical protein